MHYRKPFYNLLSKYYIVNVLHSGLRTKSNNDIYNEIIVDKISVGKFVWQNNVFNEIRSRKYDVIIAMFDLHYIKNILISFLFNKKIKFIWWGCWLTDKPIIDYIKIQLTKNNSSIFYSNDHKNQFIKAGVIDNSLYVANNTIDVGKRFPCYKHKIKDTILFVGSLDPRKQIDVLINAFSNIKDNLSNINLVIVGKGKEEQNLKDLVKTLNIRNRVFFKGEINDPILMLEFYKIAIVSVSFGQAGLSVLQSLGFGVPFITKRNAISGGEISNIIDNYNGFLCNDMKSLESILFNLCKNKKYSRLIGKKAYDYYSDNCTLNNMVDGFKSAIEE